MKITDTTDFFFHRAHYWIFSLSFLYAFLLSSSSKIVFFFLFFTIIICLTRNRFFFVISLIIFCRCVYVMWHVKQKIFFSRESKKKRKTWRREKIGSGCILTLTQSILSAKHWTLKYISHHLYEKPMQKENLFLCLFPLRFGEIRHMNFHSRQFFFEH